MLVQRYTPTRRRGLSLTEVLAALFIMAIGTLAVLTLFPLGMLSMAQALKDDRTSQCATQADAYLRDYWKQNVVENPSEPAFVRTNINNAFDNPDGANPGFAKGLAPIAGLAGQPIPSYPVYCDPMGFGPFWSSQNTPAHQFWVGGAALPLTALPRRSLVQIQFQPPAFTTPQQPGYAERTCSQMDGFGYDASGVASQNSGAVERELRYNWAWILQQPDRSIPTTASMTVVVYDKRPFLFAAGGAEQVFTPIANGTAGTVGYSAVSFPTGTALNVRKGGWILDATYTTAAYVPAGSPMGTPPIAISAVRNANFYRVVSVVDNGATVDVELQTPLKPDTKTPFDPNGAPIPDAAPTQRTFIVVAGVSEVFERPLLTAAGP